MEDVVKGLVKSKEPVPTPLGERKFSGKFIVRVPAEVHRTLAIEAEESQVSMNQLVLSRLLGVTASPTTAKKKRANR